jgi:hypothetical protein
MSYHTIVIVNGVIIQVNVPQQKKKEKRKKKDSASDPPYLSLGEK